MNTQFLSHFLPTELLEHFTITNIEELHQASRNREVIQIDLEENNTLPSGYDESNFESKGFYKVKTIQDFPIRGKAVYLAIKRRRWRQKDDHNIVIHNDFSIIADGSKLTQELSDFLKSTGQDTSRLY